MPPYKKLLLFVCFEGIQRECDWGRSRHKIRSPGNRPSPLSHLKLFLPQTAPSLLVHVSTLSLEP